MWEKLSPRGEVIEHKRHQVIEKILLNIYPE